MAQINIENLPAKIVEIVTDLAKDFKPVVQQIESITTKQLRIITYRGFINKRGRDDKATMVIIGLALIKAGANYNDVKSAWDTLRGDRWHRTLK